MFVKSDLYIRGAESQRTAIVKMVMTIAERIGAETTDESALNIPIGMVMNVLAGDALHLGLLVGLNTEDSECVVMRVELPNTTALMTLYDALLECFNEVEIEENEDVEDVPWPFWKTNYSSEVLGSRDCETDERERINKKVWLDKLHPVKRNL